MKNAEQMGEIERIVKRLGMKDYEELADAAVINRETMRKYANGYQPMPAPLLNAIRLVEQNRILQSGQSRDSAAPKSLSVSYSLMEIPNLINNVADLATKLRQVSPQDRKYVIGNIRALLDALEDSERKSQGGARVSSRTTSDAEPLLDEAEAEDGHDRKSK